MLIIIINYYYIIIVYVILINNNINFFFSYIVLLIVALVAIGTFHDLYDDQEEHKSLKKEILLCFSARRNLSNIFSINYRHRGFDALNILRFTFSTIASVGHRQIQVVHVSNVTAKYFEMVRAIFFLHKIKLHKKHVCKMVQNFQTMASRIYSMIFHNGSIIVDGFLGFGGLVLGYQLMEYLERSSKNFNVFLLILKRLIR